jgi:hypothetical protein
LVDHDTGRSGRVRGQVGDGSGPLIFEGPPVVCRGLVCVTQHDEDVKRDTLTVRTVAGAAWHRA